MYELPWNGLNNTKGISLNTLTTNDYYDRLKMIALALFEWTGLPESCNEKFLEEILFEQGKILFFKDEELGFLNLPCTASDQLNVYREPLKYTANSVNYKKEFKRTECVLIRNNRLERPTEHTTRLFTYRLGEVERTIDVNVKHQKTPVMITCDEKDRLTVINFYKQLEENEPLIIGGKGLDLNKIQAVKLDAPFVTPELQQYKRDIWNEALTFFGINNANADKRERLITDEVNANNEVIDINAQAMLLTRQEACKQINEMYNLNVTVRMRSRDEIMGRDKQGKEEND